MAAKKKTNKKTTSNVVLTQEQFDELTAKIRSEAVEEAKKVVTTKGKATKKKTTKKSNPRKAVAKKRGAEALARCMEESGKSEAEVKLAFREAHKAAAEVQKNGGDYKSAYNETLMAEIGCERYVTNKAA